MHEQLAESIGTPEHAVTSEEVVVPSISTDTGTKTGGYPSALEWPANGVLFSVREALLKALDRPEHEDSEFLWSMNGKLSVKSQIPGTDETLSLEFEERNEGVSAVYVHKNAKGGVSILDGTQYPKDYARMRIAHAAAQFIRERTERALSRRTV